MDQNPRFSFQEPPQIDPIYLRQINGRNFITYQGALDLARRSGLNSLTVEVLEYPSEANHFTAVCKAAASTAGGMIASDIGQCSPDSVDPRLSAFCLTMAATRAKIRALRNLCCVGITGLEELGSFAEVIGNDPENSEDQVKHSIKHDPTAQNVSTVTAAVPASAVQAVQNTPPSAPAPATIHQFPTNGGNGNGISATEAQLRAINAIAKRRKLSGVELANFCRTATSKGLDELSKRDASRLIDSLKQAA